MKKLTIGILAHVDAGKTTLSEGLLYAAGALRTLGRVDHGDAFLDTEALERERGITIFSKQASARLRRHGDHAARHAGPRRFLRRSGAHACRCSTTRSSSSAARTACRATRRTLWRLLERYGVPTFLFINKMDLDGRGPRVLLLT